MSIYVTRMERESRLGTFDRGPYPLEIQPPTLVDDPETPSLQLQQPRIHRQLLNKDL